MMDLTVIVLCGGKGTRIQSVLGSLPKVLAPVGKKAFIEYLFSWLDTGLNGISHEIILSTCVGHDKIKEYIKSIPLNCKLSKEDKPLGTLGAVIDVVQKNNLKNNILVANGDTLFDCNFSDVYNTFKSKPSVPLLIVKQSTSKGRYGGYRRASDGKMRFCRENPEFISLGAFFCKGTDLIRFANEAPSDPSKGKMLDIDFLDRSNINIFSLPPDVEFIDIGVPSDYHLAQQFIPIFLQS